MNGRVSEEIATVAKLSGPVLRARYAELFGDATRVGNRAWLVRRIAWRLQAQAEGGLSERARRRAAELANEADVRLNPPTARMQPAVASRVLDRADPRLPAPGGVLTRPYKGRNLQVKVLERGFEHDGVVYPSLSAVAKAITGSHCSGYLFFRLLPAKEAR
jgi:hypothetical protein